MRLALSLCLAVTLQVALAAQLPQIPRTAAGVLRRIPSLDTFTRGTPPLTTGFDDTFGPLPLPTGPSWRSVHNMADLPRTADGAFALRPGLWEMTVDSFCLTDASYAPGSGDGYLYAPLKGSRTEAVATILRGAGRHTEIAQGQIQLLLWGILARTKISDLRPGLRTVARTLLTADQIRSIDSSGLDLIPPAERSRLFASLPAAVRKPLEVEADVRDRLQHAASTYQDVERVAVLAGAPPQVKGPRADLGQWSRAPGGYFIRYFPSGYSRTRVQVLLPERLRIRRDAMNRIISIEDERGGRTETTYDDSIKPITSPRVPGLKGYAFKLIRIVTPQPSGAPLVHELHDKGWTFVRSKPPARAALDRVPEIFSGLMPNLTLLAQEGGGEGRWADLRERAEQAHEAYERYDYYNERYHDVTDRPSRDSLDRLEDTEHYRDGVNAAVRGDYGDQLDWIRDNQQRQNAALDYDTSVINSLPGSSTTGDLPTGTWDPGGGTAVAAGGGRQRLGMSGRGH